MSQDCAPHIKNPHLSFHEIPKLLLVTVTFLQWKMFLLPRPFFGVRIDLFGIRICQLYLKNIGKTQIPFSLVRSPVYEH